MVAGTRRRRWVAPGASATWRRCVRRRRVREGRLRRAYGYRAGAGIMRRVRIGASGRLRGLPGWAAGAWRRCSAGRRLRRCGCGVAGGGWRAVIAGAAGGRGAAGGCCAAGCCAGCFFRRQSRWRWLPPGSGAAQEPPRVRGKRAGGRRVWGRRRPPRCQDRLGQRPARPCDKWPRPTPRSRDRFRAGGPPPGTDLRAPRDRLAMCSTDTATSEILKYFLRPSRVHAGVRPADRWASWCDRLAAGAPRSS